MLAISRHSNGHRKGKDWKYKDRTLSDILKNNRELFGKNPSSVFPLLIKIIDSKVDLLVQVHAEDEYPKITHENGYF